MNAARVRVIVLSGHSLLAEGIAARLGQQLSQQELMTVDANEPGALQHVIQANPAAIILDATDEDVTRTCPLDALLSALPALKIFRLDPQTERIQVVTSQQRQAWEVRDLVEMIQSEVE